MKKSVFSRYFYICITCVLFGSALVGSVMLIWANSDYRDRRFDEAKAVSRMLITDCAAAYKTGSLSTDALRQQITYYELTYDIRCYVFNEAGKIVTPNDAQSDEIRITQSAMQQVDKTAMLKLTDSHVCYTEYFTLYGEEQSESFYLLLLYPTEWLTGYTQELFVLMFAAVAAVVLLSSVVLYFNTRRILQPIEQITTAAEAYAQGEFSYPIVTQGVGELSYLASMMKQMADFIDQNEKNRKSFVSNVSHELRTPMTTISGFVDGILDGTIPRSEEKQYLQLVSTEVKRLSRLVSSMLNISKFEEGEMKLSYQMVELTDLLLSTLFMFEQKIEAKSAAVEGLDTCERLALSGDKDLLQQVFYNLIENAVKFVNPGGTLSFQVTSEEQSAQVCIRNSGDGLTEEEISRVFDRFYKTDASRGRDTTGVGLGLSIVSRIIRLHNGTIAVRSVVDEYTEFVIRLPLKPKAK